MAPSAARLEYLRREREYHTNFMAEHSLDENIDDWPADLRATYGRGLTKLYFDTRKEPAGR